MKTIITYHTYFVFRQPLGRCVWCLSVLGTGGQTDKVTRAGPNAHAKPAQGQFSRAGVVEQAIRIAYATLRISA